MRFPKYAPGHRSFSKPKWQGEALEGRTVLPYAEQGQGDTLQFSRCGISGRAGWAGLYWRCRPRSSGC